MSGDDQKIDGKCWCSDAAARRVFGFSLADDVSFDLYRCEGCGVHFLHPQPTLEQLLPYYAQEYYGATRKKFIGPIASIVGYFQSQRSRLVAKHISAGRVLDVGCGNGGFLAQLKEKGYETEGTELTEASAQRVPVGITVHVGDLLSLNLGDEQFDAITLWHVFEHLSQPHETCQKIHRLLKPGGRLFLSMPNAESWQANCFGKHWFHLDPPRHLFGFGPRSLGRLLDVTGFDIESVSTLSLEQNPYGFMQSCLNAVGFPRERAYETLKGVSDSGAMTRLMDLCLLALLAAPAFGESLLASLAGHGATMTVVVRRRG